MIIKHFYPKTSARDPFNSNIVNSPKIAMLKKKVFFLLAAIVFIALALRLPLLFSFDSYTFDELISVEMAKKPILESWQYLKWEMHPPLYFYFLHFWMNIFGSGEIGAKSFSLFAGLLTVVSLYFLNKEIFSSKKAGIFSALVYIISPFLAFYGVWARMYSLLFLFSTLSFYFFLKIFKKENKVYWIFYLLATLAALYTHITAPLIILTQIIYAAFVFLSKKEERKFILKVFIPIFLFLLAFYAPWFIHFIKARMETLNFSAWYFHDQPNKLLFFYNPLKFFVSDNLLITNNLGLLLILILFSMYFIRLEKQDGKLKMIFDFSKQSLFPILIFLISFFSLSILGLYVLRYFLIPCLGLILIFGKVFEKDSFNKKFRFFLFLLLVLVSLPSFFLLPTRFQLSSFKKPVSFIEENERGDEKIITAFHTQLLPLRYYYKGKLESNTVIDDNLKNDDFLLMQIKTNYYSSLNDKNVENFKDLVAGKKRVFFVFSEGGFVTIELAKNWFLENGWKKEMVFADDKYDTKVWIMEKK